MADMHFYLYIILSFPQSGTAAMTSAAMCSSHLQGTAQPDQEQLPKASSEDEDGLCG